MQHNNVASTVKPARARSIRLFNRTPSIGMILAYTLLVVWAALSLMPLYWMFSVSFTRVVTLLRMPPDLFPSPVTLENYRRLLTNSMLPRWLLNSAFVTTVSTLISLFVSSYYGYIFAKKEFPGNRLLFWTVLSTLMVPFQILAIPIFLMFRDLGLLNTYWALIIPGLFSPFGVFLMRQSIKTLPSSLLEAARIDGCTDFGIYWRIILPLSKPGLAVLGIFTFVTVWNDFFWPLIVLNRPNMFTASVGLPTLQGQWTDFGLLMAGSALSALPMIITFLLFQRYFLQGITVGGVKG
jgi:multiple sugar transport system permease protein